MKRLNTTKATSFLVAFFFCLTANAQNSKLGSWDIVGMNMNLRKNWTIYAETQTRSQSLTQDFYYHELKAGLQYNFPKKGSVLFGVGDYKTYDYPGNFKSPANTKEFRMWQQLVLINNIDRIKIEHRYRIEQRWVNGDFFNRFRYRFNPIVPINKSTITTNTLYATAFDEVFFTNEAPYFLRNRVFGGLGYQFSKTFLLQGGFIRQYDYRKADDGSGKNSIQLMLLFTIDKTQTKIERHPSTMD
jgi:hypothetical protein